MKPIKYYETNPYSCPVKIDYTTVFIYSGGKVVWQGTGREHKALGSHPPFTGVVEKVLDLKAFKEATVDYMSAQNKLHEEFKRDLFEEHGVTGHPKAELCYQMAWEDGHSSGLFKVANEFDRLVQLIKD